MRNTRFPAGVRRMILAMMNARSASVADLARLNFLLGELYAEAVAKTARKHRVKLRSGRLSRADAVSPGNGGAVSRTENGGDVADGRRRGDRGAAGCAGGLRFPSGRHGRRRQGRAAGSLLRFLVLSRCARGQDRAEHRRHCAISRRFPPERAWSRSSPSIPDRATW